MNMSGKLDRAAIRRGGILAAAVALADRDGVDALSMRSLAQHLGLGTMTLYSYVADKDELFDLMLDEVTSEMLVPEPMPVGWRDALRAIARRTRDTLDRHPWIFDARPRRPRRRLNTMRHIEQSLTAVEPLEADEKTAGAILMAVDDYVMGHAYRKRVRQQLVRDARAAAARGAAAPTAELDGPVSDVLDAGELPRLAQGVAAPRTCRSPRVPPEADFDLGLEWLLEGIQTRLDAPKSRI